LARDDQPQRVSRADSAGSLLNIVQGLKSQIQEKERLLRDKSRSLIYERNFVEDVIASISDSVVIVDREGVILRVNTATRELLGATAEELCGEPVACLWADPVQAAEFRGEAFKALLEGGPVNRSEMLYRGPHGTTIPVAWTGAPIRNDSGEVKGYVGIAHDMRAERRLQEEKLKVVRAMAASVAHEIRNPLGAIKNSVSVLLRDLDVSGDDQTLLEIVYEETQRISSIVDDFLAFARPRASRFHVGGVQAVIEDTIRLLRMDERAGEGVDIELELPDDLPDISFDPDQLKQIVLNLMLNALDAVAGQGTIRLCGQRARKGGLVLELSDDGPGISEDVKERIFEPFVTSKARGSGLGLAIVKTIMESHRGALDISSRAGDGTRVTLRFPALAAPDEPGVELTS
jgi:two-component system, sporulation sensor kinase E